MRIDTGETGDRGEKGYGGSTSPMTPASGGNVHSATQASQGSPTVQWRPQGKSLFAKKAFNFPSKGNGKMAKNLVQKPPSGHKSARISH